MPAKGTELRATRAVVRLNRFAENLAAVRRRVGDRRRICAALKADAYGHGAAEIARAAVAGGADCLGVATVEEGAALRAAGITAPVLLLSQALPGEIPAIVEHRLSPAVSDAAFAGMLGEAALKAGVRLPVHLKIDTGMGRLGCTPADAPSLAAAIAGNAGLEHAGTATHFAVADSPEPADVAYTRRQTAVFVSALDAIRTAGFKVGIVHAANSGAVALHPEAWFDMVRPGIALYGYAVAASGDPALPALTVTPVMELRTKVVLMRKVASGDSVSYGRTWVAGRDTTVAVLPAGYADGLPRTASNRWQAVIGGRAYPLVGTICMDQCMADLGPAPDVRRWDDAVIFGGKACGADLLAEAAGTIPYEVLCNVSRRVPRVYEGAVA